MNANTALSTTGRGVKVRNKKASGLPKKPAASNAKPSKAKNPPKADKGTKKGQMSKQDMLIERLHRPDGATVGELADATGWQAHSIRGAMSGGLKRKLGLKIASEKVEGRGRVYRIA